MAGDFWYPTHWQQIANTIKPDLRVDDHTGKIEGTGILGDQAISLLESRDRYLEDFINSLSQATTSAARVRYDRPGGVSQVIHSGAGGTWPTGWTKILFDTIDYDTSKGLMASASDYTRITFPVAGTVAVSTTIPWLNNGAGGFRYILFAVNNASVFVAESTTGLVGPDTTQTLTTFTNVNAGDYYQVWGFQDSGADVSIGGAVTQCSLSAAYI